jgi:hypothetical protein
MREDGILGRRTSIIVIADVSVHACGDSLARRTARYELAPEIPKENFITARKSGSASVIKSSSHRRLYGNPIYSTLSASQALCSLPHLAERPQLPRSARGYRLSCSVQRGRVPDRAISKTEVIEVRLLQLAAGL